MIPGLPPIPGISSGGGAITPDLSSAATGGTAYGGTIDGDTDGGRSVRTGSVFNFGTSGQAVDKSSGGLSTPIVLGGIAVTGLALWLVLR